VSTQAEYIRERDPALRITTAVIIAVFITLIGYVAMTVGSSPTVKGASFIWLPAALQLVAGVWLGPWLGLLAGGLGAYAAGILAYGGWGIVDIIMNPIAGGVANAMLPAILLRSTASTRPSARSVRPTSCPASSRPSCLPSSCWWPAI